MVEKLPMWMDGKIVPYEAATTSVLSHSLHYGVAAFEGELAPYHVEQMPTVG